MNRCYQHNRLRVVRAILPAAVTALTVLLSCQASGADGGLQLSQTRVIFDARAKNAKATISNQSDRVYLVKTGVLATPDPDAAKKDATVPAAPFMVTPPLFRLEPDSQHSVLVVRNGTTELPTDRESVFYLSMLAIPATAKQAEEYNTGVSARVSVGIQTVIKLFYRPAGLSMPAGAAAESLTFRQTGHSLQVGNPSPYFVTLARLSLNGSMLNVRDTEAGAMISPFSVQNYPVTGLAQKVSWTTVNDYGGESAEYHAGVTQDDNVR
ncbi:fimbrial biogenesis chaperone [Morganella sp. B601]|uniref:fimbrial biogenesis chaperone n=1 Tax=Morganella sp. B601 TaxID=3444315 RepID=UPI003EB96DBE